MSSRKDQFLRNIILIVSACAGTLYLLNGEFLVALLPASVLIHLWLGRLDSKQWQKKKLNQQENPAHKKDQL
jgi:hypothetical protein